MTNKEKADIRAAMSKRIQDLRRLAGEYASENDGKNESKTYAMVDEFRHELQGRGFSVESYAGGINSVRGVSVRIVAHRGANWEAFAYLVP